MNSLAARALYRVMLRILPLALVLAAAPIAAQPTPASAPVSAQTVPASGPVSAQTVPASGTGGPRAAALFERDWVLANWALKRFDGDRDILLSSAEAAAAAEFRKIADADGDGRVTPAEYRAARAFILARY